MIEFSKKTNVKQVIISPDKPECESSNTENFQWAMKQRTNNEAPSPPMLRL